MHVCGLLQCHVGLFIFVRVDGGVTNNDFIMQMLSDLTQLNVDRPVHSDMAALGAAFLAGLATGINEAILKIIVPFLRSV